jgi:outer membrane protein
LGVLAQTTSEPINLPDTLSLKESLRIGLENSRTLKKAYIDEDKAKFQRDEIRGSGLPQLKAYGQYNNFISVYPQALPGGIFGGEPGDLTVVAFGVPQSLKAGLQFNQLIFSNSYLIGLKAARTGEEFYNLLAQQTEEDVIHDISMNYLATVQLELQKDNLLANIDQLKGLERILQSQYENDLARKVDLNRVKVNLTSIQSELENLEIGIEQREGYLKLIMGVPVNAPLILDKSLADGETLVSSFEVQEFILTDRKDIQILNVQDQLYEYELKNIKSAMMPQLVGFADYNQNTFSNTFDYFSQSKVWYEGFLIGLKLDVPIFDGLITKSKAAQSRLKSQQLDLDRILAEDNANLEYQNAINKYYNSINTLESLKDNLALAKTVISDTEVLYKEGLSPLTDLLAAETAIRVAQSSYNNQIIQVRITQLEILNSTGKIKNLIN